MFCMHCGKEIPDESRFCPVCGAEQTVKAAEKQESGAQPAEEKREAVVQPAEEKPEAAMRSAEEKRENGGQPAAAERVQAAGAGAVRNPQPVKPANAEEILRKNKKLFLCLGGACVLCLAAIVLVAILKAVVKPTIDLNDYVTVAFDGFETVGTAYVEFDRDSFVEDYDEKLSKNLRKNLKKSSGKNADYYDGMLSLYDDEAAELLIDECVEVSVDPEKGLNNGDVVTLKWDCEDEDVLDVFGYKLKYEDTEYTVEGLEEAETFDPFANVEVTFEGYAPSGKASVLGGISDLHYELDKNSNLKNGDKVTVTVSCYGDDLTQYCIENMGKIPASTQKEYVVEGLISYVQSASEVSDDALESMKSQATDVYTAYVAREWDEDEMTLSGFTYLGNYLLTSKKNADNALYLVYRADARIQYEEDDYDGTVPIYWYIEYGDLVNDQDGKTVVDVSQYSVPYTSFKFEPGVKNHYGWSMAWYPDGYETLDALYKDVVIKYADTYNHEDNIDESAATTAVDSSAATEEEDEEDGDGEDGVIFPDSSDERLDEDEVKNLSDEDLRYAINELYARHGYIFKDEELGEYYSQFDWYEGKVKAEDFSMDMFNDVEQDNVEMLQKERDRR